MFADRFGRKRGIMLVSIVCLIFSIASAFSPNIYVLLVLRFFLGLGIGGTSIVFTIMTEYLPANRRGKILTNFGFFWVLGTCFEILVAYLFLSSLGWRGLLLISALPFLILFPFNFWIRETPHFLVKSGNSEKAYEVLSYVSDSCKGDLPEGTLEEFKDEKKSSFFVLLSPKYRKLSILLWVIWFTSNLDYYGITLFTPHYFEKLAKGQISPTSGTFYLFLLATTIAEMPGLLACSTAVQFIGRKKTQTIALSLCTVFLFSMLLNPPPIAGIILLIFARMFIAGASSTIWAYTPETYPTSIRATGVGTAGGFAKFGSIFSPFISIVLESYSPMYPLLVFGVLGIVSSICSFLLPYDEMNVKSQLKPSHDRLMSSHEEEA